MYYATDVTSLFKQYCLNDGEIVGDINATRSLLLYVAEGSLAVWSGSEPPQRVVHGTLLFLRRNTGFNGQAAGSCRLIASFFSGSCRFAANTASKSCDKGRLGFMTGKFPPPKISAISCSQGN